MELMSLTELSGHDVYEFCHSNDYPKNWNEDSLYMTTEDFAFLSPFLDQVFIRYHYYGPQKITLDQWDEVKSKCVQINDDIRDILNMVDGWISDADMENKHFWILGV